MTPTEIRRRLPERAHLLAMSTSLALMATLIGTPEVTLAALPAECAQVASVVTCTYSSGNNIFTVPAGVTSIDVVAVGGQGGDALGAVFGGRGAKVTGTLSVTPGMALHAVVGHNAIGSFGGFNGGGPGGGGPCPGGGGGGASDLRSGSTLDTRLLVAAGGGGGGCRTSASAAPGYGGLAGDRGDGGVFHTGYGGREGCPPGSSGSCSTGGQPAGFPSGAPGTGGDGTIGTGGAGGFAVSSSAAAGGGGGGGYSGGGGGGDSSPYTSGLDDGGGGGGGGGSSLVPSGGNATTDTTSVPKVEISYTAPADFNVASATSLGNTTMSVTFDAVPDAIQATTLANYSVAGLTLSGVPALVGSTVTLTTTPQSAQSYTVTVSNVTRASDAVPLAIDSASFTGTGATGAPPQASMSPASLAFGNMRVGSPSASQQVTVTADAGGGSLHLGALSVTGTNAANFGLGSDTCSGATLAPSASCTFLVTFVPTARGLHSATLQVADDAADSPQTVPLSGTGVAPVAQVAPASIDFGTVNVASTSGHRTVTISNTGDIGQNLVLTSETITGPNASEFAFAGDTCITQSIAPGVSCTIDLTFTPAAAGLGSATLTISDNGLGSPHTVSLTGTGGVPSADLAVGISASPNPVKSGQKVTYTITVLNAGPSTAMGVFINDSLSSQSTFVSATVNQGTCVTPVKGASGVISCSLGSIANGSSQPIQIVVTVIAKKNSVTNAVTVSATTSDPNPANNTASITTRVK